MDLKNHIKQSNLDSEDKYAYPLICGSYLLMLYVCVCIC